MDFASMMALAGPMLSGVGGAMGGSAGRNASSGGGSPTSMTQTQSVDQSQANFQTVNIGSTVGASPGSFDPTMGHSFLSQLPGIPTGLQPGAGNVSVSQPFPWTYVLLAGGILVAIYLYKKK